MRVIADPDVPLGPAAIPSVGRHVANRSVPPEDDGIGLMKFPSGARWRQGGGGVIGSSRR